MSTAGLFGTIGVQSPSRGTSNKAALLAALLLFVAYYAGAKLGFALTIPPYPTAVLWPPNAIVMGALIVASPRWWPLLILAVLPAHYLAELQSGIPLGMVTGWFVSNMAEALIGAILLRRLLGGRPIFDGLASTGIFLVCAVVAAPLLSSFLDAAFVVMNAWSQTGYWNLWSTRFFSNVLACLTIVPVVITVCAEPVSRQAIPHDRVREGLILLFGLVMVSVLVFGAYPTSWERLPALLYLPLPFLLWAALRFGPMGSSIAFLIVTLVVIWGAAHGRGPFTADVTADSALPLQLFLTFVGSTLLALAGVIEQSRNTSRRLRSSEQRFAVAFRANPEAIAISRAGDGTLLDVNDRWLAMFGCTRDDAIGHAVDEFGLAFEAHKGSALREQDADLKTRAGTVVNSTVSTEAIELDNEECIITTVRDVTELKRALRRLRRSDERTQLVLKATNDVIFDWNVADDALWWNDNGEAFFGKWADDRSCTLAAWSNLLHPEDKDRITAGLARQIAAADGASDSVSHVEYRLRRAEGSYAYVHGRSLVLRGRGGRALRVIGSLMDITDRKRAEEANLQLVHVSRLAVLGELTASIAHEINQPLGAILSNADSAEILLSQKDIPVGELRQIIRDIRNDDLRAGEVVKHIRNLLRKRELTMRPFDLNCAVRDVLRLVSADLGRHRVLVETEFKPLPIVVGDQVQVQQVVLNLIFNAVDAMNDVAIANRRLWIRTSRLKGGGVEVSVADSGLGIAPDHAQHVFESFFTTKEHGMGLGLSIARSIIEAHGGTIDAEACNGGGAIFRFVLPHSA